jgi:hypothetical protein
MATAWAATQKSLESYGGLSGALHILANLIYFLAELILVLAIYQIDFNSVYLPISTVIISLSFALSPTIQSLVTNLYFILVMVPYENGDRVAIENIAGGGNLTVQAVNFVSSEFTDSAGKRVIVPNTRVATLAVTNLRRSPVASFSPKFTVPASVSGEQLKALADAVAAYVRGRVFDWKPDVRMSVSYTDTNRVEVSWGLTHVCSWSEGGKIWPAVSDFNVFVLGTLRALGMGYAQAPLPVDVLHSDGLRAAVGALGSGGSGRGGLSSRRGLSRGGGDADGHDDDGHGGGGGGGLARSARESWALLRQATGLSGLSGSGGTADDDRHHDGGTDAPTRHGSGGGRRTSVRGGSTPASGGSDGAEHAHEDDEGEGAPLLQQHHPRPASTAHTRPVSAARGGTGAHSRRSTGVAGGGSGGGAGGAAPAPPRQSGARPPVASTAAAAAVAAPALPTVQE